MKRIFIIGFPRSGTTLLQSLLGTADNVMSLPESHFFSSYYACPLDRFPLPPLVADRLYFPRLWGDKKYYKQFVFDTDLIPESAKHEAESLKPQTFIQLLDNTAESCNQTTWVEKTPMHIRRIPAIQRHIPNAVFIHIIR
ncbi:sulfotransferase, partial [PVC group bacterium]|nr:sulfotransferase [PVC group bacterium]